MNPLLTLQLLCIALPVLTQSVLPDAIAPATEIEKAPNSVVGNVVCPGGTSQCPDGSTCCKLTTGQWGCCPQPNAVCCNDGQHCCPQGYTCNVGAGSCSKMLSTPWLEKTALIAVVGTEVGNVVCPGGTSQCPDGSTCCKLTTGQWGCCPIPNAVCCSDHKHCCPNGYTCSSGGLCMKTLSTPWLEKSASIAIIENEVGNVVCPGGTSQCPDGSTCCKLTTGQWGCCPIPNAVCCNDGQHCCPQGYTCNVGAGSCSKMLSTPQLEKTASIAVVEMEVGNVVCPGGTSQCPDGNTCCQSSTGQWGCCPSPNAVCCSDHKHCCPNGYTCSSGGLCMKTLSTPWLEKSASSLVVGTEVGNVVCPGGTSQCPDGSTCCKLTTGQWGCCPIPNAVCCNDGQHCCPQGYTCNVGAGSCSKMTTTPWLEKTASSLVVGNEVGYIVCPDKQSQCPDGSTCCKLTTGKWGCCPYREGVCCDDHHCCPLGYTCSTEFCAKLLTTPWLETDSSLIVGTEVGNVVCPGGTSQCPDGSTCCKLTTGQWGCCPQPNAVCCNDGQHCCPQGYTCNVGAGSCSKMSTTPWLEKTDSSLIVGTEVGNVVCPGGTSQCPDGSTCCKLTTGQWGCCPQPNAVCCNDGQHCCPQGYTCNVGAGSCSKMSTTPWLEKTDSSLIVGTEVGNVVCPGGTSQCPDGSTCCKLTTGQWGCCPIPNAVCCNDGQHCCPQGYTCNVGAGSCSKMTTTTWLEKTASSLVVGTEVGNVVCPGGTSQCPDGSTCCKLTTGQWGCCPIPNAVCCNDGQHCCPQGYTCNVGAGSCSKLMTLSPLLRNYGAIGGLERTVEASLLNPTKEKIVEKLYFEETDSVEEKFDNLL